MSIPARQWNAKELVDRLNKLLAEPGLNEVELRRIRRDAEPLRTVDPSAYYDVFGACAGVAGDLPEARSQFEASAAKGVDDADTWLNYAKTMSILGQSTEVGSILARGLKRFPDTPRLVREALPIAIDAGFISLANDLVGMMRKLKLESPPDESIEAISECASLLKSEGRQDTEVASAIELVRNHLMQFGYKRPPQGFAVVPADDEDERSSIACWIVIDDHVDRIADVELEIYRDLARRTLEIETSGFLSFLFSPADKESVASPS